MPTFKIHQQVVPKYTPSGTVEYSVSSFVDDTQQRREIRSDVFAQEEALRANDARAYLVAKRMEGIHRAAGPVTIKRITAKYTKKG